MPTARVRVPTPNAIASDAMVPARHDRYAPIVAEARISLAQTMVSTIDVANVDGIMGLCCVLLAINRDASGLPVTGVRG